MLLKFIDENIANLSKENDELQKLVNNATIHAYNLKNLSDYLQSLLSDPQKFAKKAIDAVNAYTKVADTIKKVLEYAREADNNGGKALEMVTIYVVYE